MMDYRKLLAAAVMISVLAGVVFSSAARAGSEPAFHTLKKNVDLGEFYEGIDIVYDFKIRNNGGSELHILNVKPG